MKKNIVDDISIKMMCKTNDSFDVTDDDIISMISTLDDINMVGCDGRTCLIHASLYNREGLVAYLLDNNADKCIQDNRGISALHAAVIASNVKIASMLLSHNIPVDIKDAYGNTPLLRASQNDLEIIQLLLDHGADCTCENNFGVSAYKAFQAYPDVIELMDKYM